MSTPATDVMNPTDRIALISGATGGIGMAICARLLESGLRVVMLGRNEAKLSRAHDTIVAEHGSADRLSIQVMNIADQSSVTDATTTVLARFGIVTDLVHAAGDGPVCPLLETTEKIWSEAVQGKLLGTVRLTRAVASEMVKRQSGNIIIVNGTLSQEVDPLFPINSLINSGLSGFAKSISRDLGTKGIRVNVVNPGATATPLWQEICHALAARFGVSADEIDKQFRGKSPLGRIAAPMDVANAVNFLLSSHATHIVGASINVDGGATCAV